MWEFQNSLILKSSFLFFLALGIAERISNTFFKPYPSQRSKKIFHRTFFYVLLGGYLLVIVVSCVSFFMADNVNLLVSLCGGLTFIGGAILRRMAIHSLNDCWSVFIEVKEYQRCVREGIYRYLKHPYYTAVMIELIGFSLLCNAYWATLLAFTVQLPLVLIRIHYENRVFRVYGQRMHFYP